MDNRPDMEKKKFLLPYGDSLRDFLNDASIAKADLKSLARSRGVFFCENDKAEYIPFLVRTGVAPIEFQELVEKVKVKEENPKSQSQSVKCTGNDFSLINEAPKAEVIRQAIKKPYSNYKLLGTPSFHPVSNGNGNDEIELEFKIERTDHTRSFDKNTTTFTGKVHIKKDKENLDINMELGHTSPETKEIANKIAGEFVKSLKSKGHIGEKEGVKKIKFNDFTNENRVLFLQRLSQSQTANELYFEDTKDIGFKPDESENFPEAMSWMHEKITNLRLQGKELHSTFFIKNKQYHKHIQMHKIEAAYSFLFHEYRGKCHVSFEFPDFYSKNNSSSELIIEISRIRFRENPGHVSQNKVKGRLLTYLQESKLRFYEEFRNK